MQSETEMKSTSQLSAVPPSQLDNCLNKLYTLDQNEKYERFLIELGTRKDVRVSAINSKPTVTLSYLNGAYVLSTSYPEGKTVRVRFRSGEKTSRLRPGGEVVESTFAVVDNIVTEKLTVEGFDVKIERVFTKMEMLVRMETNSIVCFRRYAVPTSKHTIETETSRRSSVCHPVELLFPQEDESFAGEEIGGETESLKEVRICY